MVKTRQPGFFCVWDQGRTDHCDFAGRYLGRVLGPSLLEDRDRRRVAAITAAGTDLPALGASLKFFLQRDVRLVYEGCPPARWELVADSAGPGEFRYGADRGALEAAMAEWHALTSRA